MENVVRIETVLNFLNGWASPAYAEDWDNVGLLAGCMDTPVTKIMTALDISVPIIKQAVDFGAELIISHHPVVFREIKHLYGNHPLYHLAMNQMAAIAVHTNMDRAPGGVNDVLAKHLGLRDIYTAQNGLLRIGTLEKEMEPAELAALAGRLLDTPCGGIQWSDGGHPIKTVAVCSGAGGDYIKDLPDDVDAYLTGELHYHEWPLGSKRTFVAAGHYYTEVMISKEMAARLAEAFPELSIAVAEESCPYMVC